MLFPSWTYLEEIPSGSTIIKCFEDVILRIFFELHPKFPKEAQVVACIFQKLGVADIDELTLEWGSPKGELMCALIHACHNAGPTGGTNRRSDKGVLEEGRLAGELIHIGRLNHRVSHGSQCIPPLIICEYDNDVGSLLLGEE